MKFKYAEIRRVLVLLIAIYPVLAARGADSPPAGTNVFPEGNMETVENNIPKGWRFIHGVELVEENGNRYLRFTSTTGQSAWALASLKLDPDWAALQVSARLKVSGFQKGPEAWHTARCILSFRTADGKDAGFPPCPQLTADSDWVTQTVTVDIPKNADVLLLQPGLWMSRGVMGLDDVVIIPVEKPAPFPGPTLRVDKERGLVEGTFEILTPDGKQAYGWEMPAVARLASQGGNRWIKIVNDNPLATPAIRANVRVPSKWRKVRISARLKASNLKTGPEPWQNARVVVSPRDADGQPFPSVAGPALSANSDWKTVATEAELPPGTRFLVLWAGLWQATGTLEIDDVQVTPLAGD